ncbi:family 43 glycosylhydrolase [Paenibacillus mesotrionivorans]|uniref:Family 43 glycosylhydrolase n=1 Tax=Paenibacillus mesotrionivorans TaxID=3160968 RepID=A0ACC7NYP3_9BACL
MTTKMNIRNPLIVQRADPWIYRHTDGYYYFTASVPEYDRIEIRRARTLMGLAEAEPAIVWRKHETGPMSANIWAPELHFINDAWYVYYAAAKSTETVEGCFDHRIFVLENKSSNPLEGCWTEKGQLRTGWESFSLDATTFAHQGIRYLVWAQRDPDIKGNSNLYMAEMDTPWSITGPPVMLTMPEYGWEQEGFLVNEGPAVIRHGEHIFITYSASATDHRYCMGLLWASCSSNLLEASSWSKSPVPVFQTCEANGQYGPGHNSFTQSEDGLHDMIVYHARNYKRIEGDPLYDPNRHTRVQRFTWTADGMPDFGEPAADN